MVNSLFQGITNFLLTIVLKVSAFFFTPVYWLLERIFPNLTQFLDTAEAFVNNYILSGLAFVKEVIFNVTGFPRALVSAVVLFYVAKYSFKLWRRPLLFVYRMITRIGLLHSSRG